MSGLAATGLAVHVVELNPYAPRPFVFTEAALCLRDAIRATGLRSELWVNQADARAITIVLGAVPPRCVVVERLDPRKTVVFNFEQFGSTSALVGDDYRQWLKDRLVADYHSHNVAYLKREHGDTQQAFELPLVPSPALAYPAPSEGKTVDVLFFGTLSERRARILQALEAAGLSVQAVSGAYANELAPAIVRARLVLHVHFYETGLFPVARVLQPVVQGVPVVCETSALSQSSDWSRSGIVFADYPDLVEACKRLLQSPDEARERARRSQRFARELDFETPFTRLLQAVLRSIGSGAAKVPTAHESLDLPPAAPEPPDDGRPLSTAEIEAILAREATQLPPESHLPAAPIPFKERQLADFRLGRWAMALLVVLGLLTMWQSVR
ncbi:MAG TPA: glycosyltransferase [Ramlibacter sp.]|nr:glycosyltransferase [Ramlibacter sp.]